MNAKSAFYEKDITPPVGIYLAGFGFRNKPSEGINDPLYLRIVVLQDESEKKFIIVSADVLKFPKDMSYRLKLWVSMTLNLDPSCLLLNSSHTHCGPLLSQSKTYPQWPLDPAYVNSLENDIKSGILNALGKLEDSKFEYGLSRDDFAVSRRLPKSDGTVGWGANESGYCDNDIPVITVYDSSDKLKAVICSCACHPTSKSGYSISADYPGAISRALKKNFGDDVYTIFLQGAGGSSKPKFYDKETMAFVPANPEEVEELGKKSADKICSFINSGKMRQIKLRLSSEEKIIKFPLDSSVFPSDSALMDLIENDSNDYGTSPLTNRMWAENMLERKRTVNLYFFYDMLVNKTYLAEGLTLIGCSGELTAEAGRIVKETFSGGDLILLGYCFYTDAYIPTDEMLPEGGYEVLAASRGAMLAAPFKKGINNIFKSDIFRS